MQWISRRFWLQSLLSLFYFVRLFRNIVRPQCSCWVQQMLLCSLIDIGPFKLRFELSSAWSSAESLFRDWWYSYFLFEVEPKLSVKIFVVFRRILTVHRQSKNFLRNVLHNVDIMIVLIVPNWVLVLLDLGSLCLKESSIIINPLVLCKHLARKPLRYFLTKMKIQLNLHISPKQIVKRVKQDQIQWLPIVSKYLWLHGVNDLSLHFSKRVKYGGLVLDGVQKILYGIHKNIGVSDQVPIVFNFEAKDECFIFVNFKLWSDVVTSLQLILQISVLFSYHH